ncbi:uncharacterized protein LOC133307350 isoform X2 [Gastrolobium bilobum]|uniref:uncharacterized protein LOC133307350 isoform X2 n=1 Tax=Gastrolobium bilobum TaxID=150636 RepID=UPI002AAFC1B4|nr:uncharacterized protein LOC133307350 isoform X2 [Gastrolobium bilobum]
MSKRDTSDSESEDASNSSSESEEAEEIMSNGKKNQQQGVSEYEKQRLSRIAENRARLEALGLPQMASSFKGMPQKAKNKKGKQKVEDDDDDEEYKPEHEGEPRSQSSSEEDGHDKDEDFAAENAAGTRKRKAKNKGLKMKGRVSGKKHGTNSEYIDEDEALRQAIALSLQDSAEGSYSSDKNAVNINNNKAEKKGNIHIHEDNGRTKNKKSFTSRLQMTEDELVLHFFQLDGMFWHAEAGKGTVTIRDLQRAAIAHDFIWTDRELADMIRYFDSDGDGKINLDDFRKIVVRCNMIKGS